MRGVVVGVVVGVVAFARTAMRGPEGFPGAWNGGEPNGRPAGAGHPRRSGGVPAQQTAAERVASVHAGRLDERAASAAERAAGMHTAAGSRPDRTDDEIARDRVA